MSIRDKVLSEIQRMPALPGAATELIPMLQSDDCDTEAVTEKISLDPALTAQVLKIANSAAFGCSQEISSVRDAFMRLGAKQVLAAITGAAVAPQAQARVGGYELREGALWENCVAVAMATDAFAEVLGIESHPQAFTAGLLSDIGKIVLGPFVDEHSTAIDAKAFEEGISYDQAEREIIGVDHAEAGAVLLEAWGLPEGIVQAVRWHHEPEQCPEPFRELVDIVHLANFACLLSGFGSGDDGTHYTSSKETLGKFALSPNSIELAMAETCSKLDEVRESFGLSATEN